MQQCTLRRTCTAHVCMSNVSSTLVFITKIILCFLFLQATLTEFSSPLSFSPLKEKNEIEKVHYVFVLFS